MVKQMTKARPGLLKSARMRAEVAKPEPVRRPRPRVARVEADERVEQLPGYYLG